MFRKIFVGAIAAVAIFAVCQSAHASINLTDAELLGQTVVASNNATFFGVNDGTMGSGSYTDGAGAMTGAAGSTAFLSTGGYVDYTVDATALARINAALASGEDAVRVLGYNDNDDIWQLGLTARDTSGGVYHIDVPVNGSVAGPPNGALIVLSGLAGKTLASIGVSVDYDSSNTGSDAFHASWSQVPEPGTMAIWSLLAGLGLVCVQRRRRK